MGAVLVIIHLNGHSNVLLDADSPEEEVKLRSLLLELEDQLVPLQERAEQLALEDETLATITHQAAPPDIKPKRGRPKGSSTGFDPETKRRLVRQAQHLRTQGVTWGRIGGRFGISADTIRRWVEETEPNE